MLIVEPPPGAPQEGYTGFRGVRPKWPEDALDYTVSVASGAIHGCPRFYSISLFGRASDARHQPGPCSPAAGRPDPRTAVDGADEHVADVAHHADHLLVPGVPSLAHSRRTWTSMVRMPPKKS
jgi:hypothetical protein